MVRCTVEYYAELGYVCYYLFIQINNVLLTCEVICDLHLFHPQGGHSTKNVHGPFEQSFSDPTLNEWLEILISTPKQGNWDKF